METGFFNSRNGSRRYYRLWKTGKPVKGSIVLVHGYAEHGGRYAELAGILNENGYNAWAVDHYGHGKSDGRRSEVPRFELFVEDLYLFIHENVTPSLEGKALFLYGHSMGGAISLLYTASRQEEMSGLILSGPVVRPGSQTGRIERAAVRFLSSILPSLPFRPFDPEFLSHDPDVVQAYIQDPLVYTGKMKIRMGNELLRAGDLMTDQVLSNLRLPILIMHGGEDRAVELSNSRTLNDLISSSDRTYKIFEGMYHEIHNEADRAEVFRTVLSWLDRHVEQANRISGQTMDVEAGSLGDVSSEDKLN